MRKVNEFVVFSASIPPEGIARTLNKLRRQWIWILLIFMFVASRVMGNSGTLAALFRTLRFHGALGRK
jgi:hypothetical protein